jgi:tRNA(fMet)-specific endonuclease VapC
MSAILVDTSAYVRFMAGDEKVLDWMGRSDRILLSVFVLGELIAGFKAGTKEKQNRQLLERFLAKTGVEILDATWETSDCFGLIKSELKKLGRPIPINDVWIGAHALETGSVLVTDDQHFKIIPGLRIWPELA